MLFKGTSTRSAEDIAQQVDSIGGQLDAFTAKECASYYIKVLDEHLSRAVDLIADLVQRPAFRPEDIAREKKVIIEEIKMVEDIPDDLVHEMFAQSFWPNHPPGAVDPGTTESVNGISSESLRRFFDQAYVAGNVVIAAAGISIMGPVRDLIGESFAGLRSDGDPIDERPPMPQPGIVQRGKEIEQSHLCLGTPGYSQTHDDRYASYVLNTVLAAR